MKILERVGTVLLIFAIMVGQLYAATMFGRFLATGNLTHALTTFAIELTVVGLTYVLIKL